MIISVRFLNDFELLFLWTHDRRVADTYFQSIHRFMMLNLGNNSDFQYLGLLYFCVLWEFAGWSNVVPNWIYFFVETLQRTKISDAHSFDILTSPCFVCIDAQFACIIFRLCPRWFGLKFSKVHIFKSISVFLFNWWEIPLFILIYFMWMKLIERFARQSEWLFFSILSLSVNYGPMTYCLLYRIGCIYWLNSRLCRYVIYFWRDSNRWVIPQFW